jgi:uncharacterized protein
MKVDRMGPPRGAPESKDDRISPHHNRGEPDLGENALNREVVIKKLPVCAVVAWLTLFSAVAAAAAGETPPEAPPGMATYYFGILVKGPKWSPEETPERAQIGEGHMAHIREMAAAGKLVLAGPFLEDGDWRGILIYKTDTLEEAQKLADEDPAVKAGRLAVTMHPLLLQKGVLPCATAGS